MSTEMKPNLCSNSIESLWLEIKPLYHKNFLICADYRPPNSSASLMHDLINNLDNALNLGYEIILLGYLNIDTCQKQTNVYNPIYDLCNILNMENLIHDPTRITSSSSTTIYHIITSMSHNHKASGVVEIAISDHYLVYTVLNFYKKFNLPKSVTIRSFKSFDICLFLTDLETVLDSFKFNVSDSINRAWITWKTIFNAVSKRHAPTTECRVKDDIIAICTFDLKQCFDTINHESLLFKLCRYGIKDHSLKWFSSYLTDRTQLLNVLVLHLNSYL